MEYAIRRGNNELGNLCTNYCSGAFIYLAKQSFCYSRTTGKETQRNLKRYEKNYVELNAYKESQTHIYSELEKVSTGIEDLKNYLMGKGTNHDR